MSHERKAIRTVLSNLYVWGFDPVSICAEDWIESLEGCSASEVTEHIQSVEYSEVKFRKGEQEIAIAFLINGIISDLIQDYAVGYGTEESRKDAKMALNIAFAKANLPSF